MVRADDSIKFSEVIDAVADSIANACVNVGTSSMSSNFDSKTVKEWTVTRQEIITPSSGDPYPVNTTTKYSIIQNASTDVKFYNKNDVVAELSKLIDSNASALLKEKKFYAAAFLHVIKLLLKYMTDSVKLYVSPYYNDKTLVFSPPDECKYNLAIDILYEGDKTYTDEQIKAYLDSIATLAIYSLPEDRIVSMSYTTSIEEGAKEIILRETIPATFSYTNGLNFFTLNIPISNYILYKKTSAQSSWTIVGIYSESKSFKYESSNNSVSYYFKIVPKSDDMLDYKTLGDDNRFGFKLTKSEYTLTSIGSGILEYMIAAPNAIDVLGYAYTSDGLQQYLLYDYGYDGYYNAVNYCQNVRPTGWLGENNIQPTYLDSYWIFTWWYYTSSSTSYYTVTTWSGSRI